jgi:predicted acylesterase/phospholipase RssA
MPSSRTAFGYQVWETVAKRNRGGKYVVGDDFAIRALSRLSALHLGGSTGAAGERVLPADILIVAVLALVLLAANLQQFVGHPTRWPWILAAGLLCLPLMLILVLLGMVLARRAVFLNRALTSTLTNVLDANARDLLRERSDDDVHALGREWVERWATLGDGAPGFVLTGTDLTTQGEVLFSLVRPRTFAHLASEEWQVFQFDPGNAPVRPEYLAEATDATEIPQMAASGGLSFGFVAAEDFVRCVVASTSIPGVFRPQRIVLSSLDGTRKVSHDVVDGGVLNNSPIHVAIDLEATHVISLELDPLVDQGTFEAEAPAAPMDLPQNLSGTLATLLRQTTSEDIRRASSWNRHLRTPGQASQTKRLVQLYRVAPRARRLGLLDFGGHYPNFTGPPDPSLGAWLEQSYADAMTLPLFWDATFEAAPAHTPL